MMSKSRQEKLSLSGIKSWPKDDRPREKLLREGEHKLSNTELLAILLRSGVKGQSAVSLARKILQKFKTFRSLSHTDLSHWEEFKGLGLAKIAQIRAAVEIGRRFLEEDAKESRLKIKSSRDAAGIFLPRMRDLKKEIFKVLFLNSKNRVVDIVEIIEGTVDHAAPIIREIFQKALQSFAVSLICAHNHPSGDCCPSRQDQEFTRELCRAGKTLQINILDHIIVGNNEYYSFGDKGQL